MQRRARIGRALMVAICVAVVTAFVLVPARAEPQPVELVAYVSICHDAPATICRAHDVEPERKHSKRDTPTTTTSSTTSTTSAPVATEAPAPAPASVAAGVEQWRDLVAAYFPASEVETALRVMACESGGDPGAQNPSGATGLMQVMTPLWSDHYGVSVEALFDPETNISIAALIWASQGWQAWSCY